jgi:Ring finger domain
LEEKDKMNMAAQEMEHPESVNASSICLEEPIVNPVVLKECRHAFCAICLMEWQKYQQREVISPSSEFCSCPICRQTLPKTTVEKVLDMASPFFAVRYGTNSLQ